MEIERTEHDFGFEDKVKEVGYWYYVNNLLTNISINKNTYSCTIEKYNAMIEFEDKTKETINDLTCTCSFYEHEDCNCPHIYALICYAFNIIKEDSRYNIKLLEKYKNLNINKIKSEFNKGNIDLIDLDILGYKAPELISYSYVLLDGEKMSTSNGTLVLVTDFMKELKNILKEEFRKRNLEIDEEKLTILANACVKFTMLNVSKNKIVNFNMENATSFAGESGIYILYSLVRINSILNNNKDIDLENTNLKFTTNIEKKLIRDLYDFPFVVDNLLKTLEPAHLTKYIFNLTQNFSRFYEEINISNEKDLELKISRIKLLECVKIAITNALTILGISTIDKM